MLTQPESPSQQAPLRPLTAWDAEAFAALVGAAFAALNLDPPPSALGVTAAAVIAHLAKGGGGTTTSPDQAGLLWEARPGGLYVSRIAVHPAHRGAGLATRMLHEAEAEARRRALPKLFLSTRLALQGNRRLFARCGFRETALHSHPGYTVPTFVDLEKPIANEPLASLGVNALATR